MDGPWTHRPAKLDVDFGYFRRYIDRMAQALRKRGEQIIVNAAVTQIKAEDGQVTGLIYQDATSGELVQVDTPNVILASGGFIGNDELLCSTSQTSTTLVPTSPMLSLYKVMGSPSPERREPSFRTTVLCSGSPTTVSPSATTLLTV